MARLWACLGAPIVIGHAGCIASPAVAMALGVPIVMPICGGGLAPLLPALGAIGLQMAATLAATVVIAVGVRRARERRRDVVISGCARESVLHQAQAIAATHGRPEAA